MGATLNPTALRKAEIAYNFGLSECSRVKEKILLSLDSKFFPLRVDTCMRGSATKEASTLQAVSLKINRDTFKKRNSAILI